MNKHICLSLGVQLTLAPLSKAVHTINKTPVEGTNYYKVKYSLNKEGGFYTENGLLKEVITKDNTKQENTQDPNYKISYVYHNYKAKINNHKGDLQSNNAYINVNSTVIVDSNYKVMSIDNWHPVVFYLNNLRSGILPVFDKKGESKNVWLKDNYHTYEETRDSKIEYSKLNDLKIEYKVSDIETVVDENDVQIPMFTFDWHALTTLNAYSTRHGKIQVNNEGRIKRLNIYVPYRISQFYIASKVSDQPGWLNLVNINQKKFNKLCCINSVIKNIFKPEVQIQEPICENPLNNTVPDPEVSVQEPVSVSKKKTHRSKVPLGVREAFFNFVLE